MLLFMSALGYFISVVQYEHCTQRRSPSGRVDGDGVRLSRYVCDETGAVGPLQLSHVDGVAQLGPVGRVVAEPVHP